MKVYKVEVGECTIAFDDLDNAIDEVWCQVEAGNDVFIFPDEMTEDEFAALESTIQE